MARKRKRNSNFKNMILVAMVMATCYFSYHFMNELAEMKTLRASIAEAEEKELNLKEKKEDLEIEKENLQNPEYLLRYAIGKYLVTKEDGEQVFKLPEE